MNTLDIFGRSIPIYGILGAVGFFCGVLYLVVRLRNWEKIENCLYIMAFAGAGAMLGAKIVYILVSIEDIATTFRAAAENAIPYWKVILIFIKGGFVFYGGLIGAIVAAELTIKYFGLEKKRYLSYVFPCLPLIHGFGRIGCYLVGCCYGCSLTEGVGSHLLSVTYTDSVYAPNGEALFAVQLLEAIIEFLLFIVFVIMSIKGISGQRMIWIYFIVYSACRFVLEFYRGDLARGIWGNFSTSQWIALILIAYGTMRLIRDKKAA